MKMQKLFPRDRVVSPPEGMQPLARSTQLGIMNAIPKLMGLALEASIVANILVSALTEADDSSIRRRMDKVFSDVIMPADNMVVSMDATAEGQLNVRINIGHNSALKATVTSVGRDEMEVETTWNYPKVQGENSELENYFNIRYKQGTGWWHDRRMVAITHTFGFAYARHWYMGQKARLTWRPSKKMLEEDRVAENEISLRISLQHDKSALTAANMKVVEYDLRHLRKRIERVCTIVPSEPCILLEAELAACTDELAKLKALIAEMKSARQNITFWTATRTNMALTWTSSLENFRAENEKVKGVVDAWTSRTDDCIYCPTNYNFGDASDVSSFVEGYKKAVAYHALSDADEWMNKAYYRKPGMVEKGLKIFLSLSDRFEKQRQGLHNKIPALQARVEETAERDFSFASVAVSVAGSMAASLLGGIGSYSPPPSPSLAPGRA